MKNEIREVPIEFCNPRLDTVNLSQNYLKELPDQFGDLALISLWLSENNFKEIPHCLYRYCLLYSLNCIQLSDDSSAVTHNDYSD